METRYLSPDETVFRLENKMLFLELAGEKHENVRLRLAFPISDPSRYITVKDSDGKELGIIRDISRLTNAQEKIIRRVLEDQYFMPVIECVESVKEQFGVITWQVRTDRGPRTFRTRGRLKSVLELKDGRVLIIDVDSNRYEVRDMESLDPKSRNFLGRLF